MRQSVFYPIKLVTLLASGVAGMMLADPARLRQRVRERVRQSRHLERFLPVGLALGSPAVSVSRGRELIDRGHLTDGANDILEAAKSHTFSDRFLARLAIEKVEYLKGLPAVSIHISPGQRNVRVLHLLTNSYPYTESGYTVRSEHVLRCQAENGIVVEAVTRLGYPVLVGKIPFRSVQERAGIAYRRMLPWKYSFSEKQRENEAVRLVVAEALRFDATVIHTTTDYHNARVAAEAAEILGIPWVYEVRGELEATWVSRQLPENQDDASKSEFFQLAQSQETNCMKAAAAVVALSEVSKSSLVARGIAAEKIVVVPNAIEGDLLSREYDRESLREELGLPTDKLLVGSVTAVVGYEGLDTLLESLIALPGEWEALVVGDGEDLPRLRRLAKNYGVDGRVHFVGRKPPDMIWKWYSVLDVFALPRRDVQVTRRITPIKPLNALALGVPVVASDLPALREVTGGFAVYVKPEDASALAAGIVRALGYPPASRDWLERRTWSENGRRYARIYNKQN